jgi:tetratricopeptide (TPR) repeat protein
VVDPGKAPLAGVDVRLLDAATSRQYRVRTGTDGTFKLAGLPHGVYRATFEKAGYAVRQDEWRFETPQDTMQKVDVPDVVLAPAAAAEEARARAEAVPVVKEAAERLRANDAEGAIARLRPILENNPGDAHARFLLALAYGRTGQHAEAADALAEVTRLTPSFAGAHFQLGVERGALGQTALALEAYDRALGLEPGHADAAYNSGLILFGAGRIEEAEARFRRGLEARPGDADLHEMVARCALHSARFAEAVEHLEKAAAAAGDPEKRQRLERLLAEARAQVR